MKFWFGSKTPIKQVLSSKNFLNGGVGRVDCGVIARKASEEHLIEAARRHPCKLEQIGTDYIVYYESCPRRPIV